MTRAALRGCLAMISFMGCGGSVTSGDSSPATGNPGTTDADNGSPNPDTNAANPDGSASSSTSVIATPHNLQVESSGYCLRAAALPLAGGVSLVQDVCSNTSLVFVEYAVGSGLAINVEGTSFCINVVSTMAADPNGLTLDLCDASDRQTYSSKTYDDGSRAFNAINTGLCLDQLNASTTIGDVLGLWTCDDNAPQKFLASSPPANVGDSVTINSDFGLYPEINGYMTRETDTASVSYVLSWIHDRRPAVEPANTGVTMLVFWGTLEQTEGDYTAGYAVVQRLLDQCAADNLQLILYTFPGVSSFTSLPSVPQSGTPIFPDYLIENGGVVIDQGGAGLRVRLWDEYTMTRYIALLNAFLAHFDDHPNFQAIRSIETSPAPVGGYTADDFHTQWMRLATEVTANRHARKFFMANHGNGDDQASVDALRAITDAAVANGWDLGAPDIYGGSTWIQTGELMMNGGTVNGVDYGPGYIGKVAAAFGNEYLTGLSREIILENAMAIGTTYLAWSVNFDADFLGPQEVWTGADGVQAFLQNQPKIINSTACPTSDGDRCARRAQ